jgi:CMP-N,N'-diacetyllegionaminic acid synthase
MKILAIIPARKGSNRIKFKNRKILGKKMLIEYTIDIAKKCSKFCDIFVTTDDQQIVDIAKKKNVLVPWLRPARLSLPKTSSYTSVRHAVSWYESKIQKIDAIILLQPTSPFRTKKNILEAISFFKSDKKKNSILSVSLVKVEDSSRWKKKINIYKPNGSIFIITKKEFYKKKSFINNNTKPFVINNLKESLDIDYPEDFNKAKKYLKK